MKVGIDTFACDGGKSGVGVYISQILKRIPPSGDRFELFGWDFDRFSFSETAPDLEFVAQCRVNGRMANSLWHLLRYPDFAKKQNYKACFFPAAHRRLPNRSPCPSIGTVHDMDAFWGSRKTRTHLGALTRVVFPSAIGNLDRVIAVSQWVKEELVERRYVKENKIVVIPNGVDHSLFYPRAKNEESVVLIQPFSFRRPYIIYASRIDYPVKNHIRLIEAFDIFKERTHLPHRLVLAGGDSNNADEVKAAALRSRFKGDIFFTGHFPAASLPELYAGAAMSVFPSLYEGFGLGILEAMASGVPVACARSGSLPETADTAALYFDPRDTEDMADRMVTLATDRDAARSCRAQGLERAKLFSWDSCAERTLEIIRETT